MEMGVMYTQQQDSYASAARVAEYEEEIRALFQRLVALEQHNRDLRSLSDEVRQTYDATLDNLAALQLQLHLCHQVLRTRTYAASGEDGMQSQHG